MIDRFYRMCYNNEKYFKFFRDNPEENAYGTGIFFTFRFIFDRGNRLCGHPVHDAV
jgi:hypothetical protein